ncbi:MAG: KH domain-containing protein [Clostridiaceae bacterium]|jgi:spoIIIJ-associated protein|nr:KH domain-containing protein [Clostridiaceae bacterium]
MKSIDKKASSIEDAVASGLKELGVTREEVEIEVIAEKVGLLKKVVVRLTLKETAEQVAGTAPAVVDEAASYYDGERPVAPVKPVQEAKLAAPGSKAAIAAEFIADVLKKMSLECDVVGKETGDGILLDVTGEDSGNVIGYRGETLDALQYLALLIANQGEGDFQKLVINAENYRAKREETLISLANKLAAKAAKTGRRVVLEPMNPFERRVLHAALADSTLASTVSEGEEPNRYVVIVPKGDYAVNDDDNYGQRRSSGGGGRGGYNNNRNGNRDGGGRGGYGGNREGGGYNRSGSDSRGNGGGFGGGYNNSRPGGDSRGSGATGAGYNRSGSDSRGSGATGGGYNNRSGGGNRGNGGGTGGGYNNRSGGGYNGNRGSGGYSNREGGYERRESGTGGAPAYDKNGEYGDTSGDMDLEVKANAEYERVERYEVKEYGVSDNDSDVTPVNAGYTNTTGTSADSKKKGPPRFRSFK